MARGSVSATLLVLAVLAVPLGGEAQQTGVHGVGVVHQGGAYSQAVDGLRDGLRELGFEEGKQYVLHVRDTKGDLTAVEAAARSLEAEKVDVIYALATSVTLAVKRATKSTPIVFYGGSDPVVVGLVETFRKPGGRLTGIHGWGTDITAKRLELLKELVPRLRRVVTFYNPDNASAQQAVKVARDAARQLKVELVERRVASVEELRMGLRALRPREADAYLYMADAMTTSHAPLIIETATVVRLPTMFSDRENVAGGALASYGVSITRSVDFSAKNVQRVLLGADPGSMPIEQFDRLHFVINMRTAKAIGLTIPHAVLARADEVIE